MNVRVKQDSPLSQTQVRGAMKSRHGGNPHESRWTHLTAEAQKVGWAQLGYIYNNSFIITNQVLRKHCPIFYKSIFTVTKRSPTRPHLLSVHSIFQRDLTNDQSLHTRAMGTLKPESELGPNSKIRQKYMTTCMHVLLCPWEQIQDSADNSGTITKSLL